MGRSLSFYTVDVRMLLRDSHIFIDKDNPNIIQNDVRPYYTSIDLDSKYKAFVPIRTNLSHKYGFVTKIENDKKSGKQGFISAFRSFKTTKNIVKYK